MLPQCFRGFRFRSPGSKDAGMMVLGASTSSGLLCMRPTTIISGSAGWTAFPCSSGLLL